MKAALAIGDVFNEVADTLICPANPWLNLSGGVNGEILRRCGPGIQEELHEHLASGSVRQLAPGTTVVTSSPLPNFKWIVHAIAIDVFYEATESAVQETIWNAWSEARELGASVVMPMLATGYGRMSIEGFARAFGSALNQSSDVALNTLLVVRSSNDADTIARACPTIELRE